MNYKKFLVVLILIFLFSTNIKNVSAQSISPCDTNPNGAECGLYLKDEMNAAYQKYINALQTGDSAKINEAFQNYKAASDSYCQNLLSRGVTTTCNAPQVSTTTASVTATTPAPQITTATPTPTLASTDQISIKITSPVNGAAISAPQLSVKVTYNSPVSEPYVYIEVNKGGEKVNAWSQTPYSRSGSVYFNLDMSGYVAGRYTLTAGIQAAGAHKTDTVAVNYNPSAQPRLGTIYISSAPGGAEIWIGGEYTKREAPTTIPGVLPGTYTITLKKEGYIDYSETKTVVAGGTATITANLEPVSVIGDIVPVVIGVGGTAVVVAVVKGIGGAIAGAKAAGAAGSGVTGAKMPPRPLPPPPKTPQRLPLQPPRQAPEKRPLPPPPKAPPPREAPPRERPAKKDPDKGDRTSSKERVQLTSSDKEELKNMLKNLPSEDILNEYKDLVKSEEWDKMTPEQRKQMQQVIFESYTEQYQGEAAWDEFTEKLFNDISKEQQKEIKSNTVKEAPETKITTCGKCGNPVAKPKGEDNRGYCSKCGAQVIWIDLSG